MYQRDLGLPAPLVAELSRPAVRADYWAEMQGIALRARVPIEEVVCGNLYYDALKAVLVGCTAFAVDTPTGPLHARIPDKPGVSYMVAPVMRTWMLPDWQVHTMPMQHLMFYAPNLTDQDIGSGPSSFPGYPFVFKEGIPEQSYMIQLAGEAERVRIVTEEKPLLDELCAYREVLCIPHIQH